MVIERPIQLPPAVKRIYPFKSHYMQVNGLAYHYLDEGRGDPVVMLHGNPTWSFFYRDLVKALSPTCRVLVPDHIGCGLSDRPTTSLYGYGLKDRVSDLEQFIHQLDIGDPITLVLHDWGGMIGTAWAVNRIKQVGRIIILNTAGFLPPGNKPIPWRIKLVRNFNLFATGAVLGLNLFAKGAVYMAPARPLAPAVRAGYLAPYNRPANRIALLKFVQDIPLVPSDPSYPMVAQTDANLDRLASTPMLICWGGRDFVFDADYLVEWRRRFPHAKAHQFDQAGHYLLEDALDRIAPLIQSFLKKHPVR